VTDGYDPDVSGPWSDVDDYPPGEAERRHRLAVHVGRGLGGEQWTGTGLLGWWSEVWPETPFLRALAITTICVGGGALVGFFLWIVSGGRIAG
jgi:hypothetical protein